MRVVLMKFGSLLSRNTVCVFSGGYYMFVEASDTSVGEVVRLYTSPFVTDGNSIQCLTLW